MNTLKNIAYRIVPVVLLVSIWFSCKDDENDALNLSRQFKPAIFDIEEGETSASISWSASNFTISGEVEYLVELSKDGENFTNVEYTTTTTAIEVTVLDTQIDIKADYYARVKALGTGDTDDSNWLVSEPFQISGEVFILPIKESDVVVDAALIKWKESEGLASILITPAGGSPFEVVITAEDAEAGEKLVTGLDPNTSYTAELLTGDEVSKGAVSFKTKPSYDGSNIIDLTQIDLVAKPNILADTLSDIPSGSVVLLKRGGVYTIPAAKDLDRSVLITSGADFNPTFAKVFMSANFNLVASSAIDSIVFKDLTIYSDNYDSKYIFNINRVGTIGKVKFDNVRGHKFRGFFRLQTGTTGTQVTDFIVNNCVVDSLRDFSLVNTNNSNTVANITVKNSTIYNARKVIDHRSPGSNTMLFENCTFNNLPTGGAAGGGTFYFIDLNTQDVANGIVIKNCIFGKSRDEGMGGNDARGIRAGANTTVSVTNTYNTSDFICTGNPIAGLLPYSGTSTALFINPDAGDFTIKDGGFAGAESAGDPRWR